MIFQSMFLNVVTFLGLSCILYYLNLLLYWKKRRMPAHDFSSTFEMTANILTAKKCGAEVYLDVYNYFKKRGLKYGGVIELFRPLLVLVDTEVIKTILVKDFMSFHHRGIYFDEEKDPLMGNALFTKGSKWKRQRTMVSPGFSPSKIKMMFETILSTTDLLLTHVRNLGEVGDFEQVFECYSTDVVSTIAMGIETNCLRDPDGPYAKWQKKVFTLTFLGKIRNFINLLLPGLASIIYIPYFSKEITEDFCNMISDAMDYRRKLNIKRKDFMQSLIQLKEKGYIEDTENPTHLQNGSTGTEAVSEIGIAVQAFMFFSVGFETTAISLGYCLHEIAMNLHIQEKLHEEICSVLNKYQQKITYDAIQEMAYLDMVTSETLRKYPVGAIVTRVCCKEFVIPGTKDVVEEGIRVIVPILGLHHDPEYFPEPDKFDPERFSEDRKTSFPSFAYIPFGGGPRQCIARKFAIVEMKVAIVALVKEFEFQPCKETKHPQIFEPRAMILKSKFGKYLRILKRDSK